MVEIFELDDLRKIRNLEKAIKIFESQLTLLTQCKKVMHPHRDFYFFSVTRYAMREEQKRISKELLGMRLELDSLMRLQQKC